MEKFWVGSQIFIKGKDNLSFEDFKRFIFNVKKYLNLNILMLWANNNYKLYEDFIKICNESEIESYLWFPVLSDNPNYKITEDKLTLNYDGSRGYGKTGQWKNPNQKEEDFLFICPNNKTAVNNLFKLFKKSVDNFKFNGVFLDRIRYSSGTNGLESLFSCFCKYCRKKFSHRYNLSLNEYIKKIKDFLYNFKKITNEDIKRWPSFEYVWELSGLKKFMNFRNISIYDVVKKFSDYTKIKSMKVGADLYSFSLSQIVSQDYRMLQDCCDWIKPMMYCHTVGPAGIPLEISCLVNAFKIINSNLSEKSILKFFENIMGIELPESLDVLLEKGISEEFLSVEIKKIENLFLSSRLKVYPGFEAVKIPGVCVIDEIILDKYIEQIHNKTEGFIASWNLLDIPESNLKFISRSLR